MGINWRPFFAHESIYRVWLLLFFRGFKPSQNYVQLDPLTGYAGNLRYYPMFIPLTHQIGFPSFGYFKKKKKKFK